MKAKRRKKTNTAVSLDKDFKKSRWMVATQAFNPNTHLGGRGVQISMSSRPTWLTKQVSRQPEVHRKTSKKSCKEYFRIRKKSKF